MSDYIFMLESHLSPEMFQVVQLVEAAAEQAGVNLFITGGAMRDMLGGYPVRDLDLTVEGNPSKLVKLVAARSGARIAGTDDNRKSTEFVTKSGLTFHIGMAHQAVYAKPGAKPQVKPATIHEDLRGRDFTINAIALSLTKASRGLLIDPTNGLGDLERREIRTTGNYTLYDDPVRIIRMLRLKARLGFQICERTQMQYENVRDAQLEQKITPKSLYQELRAMADEPDHGAILSLLDQEKLLTLFSPTLAGAKLNTAGFAKLHKLRMLIPFGANIKVNNVGPFFWVLTEKFSPREKAALVKRLGIPKADVDLWQKLDQRAKKLETALKSAKLKKASLVYLLLREAPADQILFLLYRSRQRPVQDRIKNYLTKYVPGVLEITDREVAAHFEVEPGSPKFAKAKADYILGRLDGRIRRPAPEEAEAAATPAAGRSQGRPPGRPPGRLPRTTAASRV
jgi:tRNA nucleotidyltransferase/poly(A) polymerase